MLDVERCRNGYTWPGTYSVTLTVTDNAGATGTRAMTINPINLSAHGYKQSGLAAVDLSWNGPSGASYAIYRNGATLTTVSNTTYTDTLGKLRGSYTYQICAGATCSNQVTANF